MRLKRLIASILICVLVLTSCSNVNSSENGVVSENTVVEQETITPILILNSNEDEQKSSVGEIDVTETEDSEDYPVTVPEFSGMDDVRLLRLVQDNIYTELIKELDSENYYVRNVNAIYISKEYIEEVAFNSQSNIFFGYTLDELNEQFSGTQYAFGLGDDRTTIVYEIEDYDDTYERVIRDIAIGSGVILICVTVSVVSGGVGAPAVSMIFAASAKTGGIFALSSGALSAIIAGAVKGLETGDFEEAIKASALAGADGFKWGAILGVIFGGASEAIALKGATLNGLSMNEAALIQKETGYPLDVIKSLENMEQYKILKQAGLETRIINGRSVLLRKNIDINYVDEFGRTNIERMKLGYAALDADGISYELHHIGQKADSTLAVLTKAEHMQGGNNKIWHKFGESSEIYRDTFDTIRQNIWKEYAKIIA